MMQKWVISFLMIACCLQLSSCKSLVSVQQKGLYDIKEEIDLKGINGFQAVDIYKDDFDKSVWVSPETQCVTMKTEYKEVFADKASLHVKWDKVGGGCKWIGIGFGWNNWMAKDMLDVTEVAAVQFQVKSAKGSFSNLPVAFAFEDYSGIQTFVGYNKNLSKGDFNENSWTTVTIPLSKFDFEKDNFDIEKVKQFMIQLEGDGDIYLDNIKIVTLN